METKKESVVLENSGRKPSNVVDVCGPKSGATSRPVDLAERYQHHDLVGEHEVIDQFISAQLAANESEETLKALRPQVEEAVQALIEERGLPKNFTGTVEYRGFDIVVSRPKTATWEKNTNKEVTSDPNHAIYVQQLELQLRISEQLKEVRADLKQTSDRLAKAHPNSESIKRGFRIALMVNKKK